MCDIARGQFQENKTVIGIATDLKVNSQAAFDYCYLMKPEWTIQDQEIMEHNKHTTGIMTNYEIKNREDYEFPPR